MLANSQLSLCWLQLANGWKPGMMVQLKLNELYSALAEWAFLGKTGLAGVSGWSREGLSRMARRRQMCCRG